MAEVQAWPQLRILARRAPSTAASRSASSKTTNGALPPSSIDPRNTLSAARAMSPPPTSVEPVNVGLRRRGSSISGAVTALEAELTMTFTTPGGRPARSRTSAIAMVESGVCRDDLTTSVQPAASAGAMARAAITSGKFQGVITRQGPTGWRITSTRPPPSGLGP